MPYVPANPNPIYQPAMRVISAISQSFPVTITTTFAHQYITGTIVRIDIPVGLGMPQINQQTGPISVTGATTFTMPIDTTYYDAFTAPSGSFPPAFQDGQVVPIGEVNELLKAATNNVLNPNN